MRPPFDELRVTATQNAVGGDRHYHTTKRGNSPNRPQTPRCRVSSGTQNLEMRLICRWLIRFNTTTIGFAHATAPKANPADRSEGESRRNRCARTPQTGGPFAGTPQRRLRLRSHVHQSSGTRDSQSNRESVVEDCRRTRYSAKQADGRDGTLGC